MNKEQIDKFFEILISIDNDKYDDEQQAIIELDKLLQLSEIDKNYISNNNLEDIFDYIASIAMKQIEEGDYKYFKSKINNADSAELSVYEYLLPYSLDFNIKKDYIRQCCNIGKRTITFEIGELLNIIDILKSEASGLDTNKVISEQQDFVKWCIENAHEIGLNILEITDLMGQQQHFAELCMQSKEELGINITDIVGKQEKLVEWCIKNNQQLGLNKQNLEDLMQNPFKCFTWCIENSKDIILGNENLGFLIQNYHELCVETSKNNIYPYVNMDSLENITKWYNENKEIKEEDARHFINEFCKICIDELSLDSNNILNIVRNNINDPEYIKRINRK